ncbi:MAG: hypothetical protein LAO31_00090 [Acidobacteriia bacterium]|nr:hypothetical protein [Terriglobia bacterium]
MRVIQCLILLLSFSLVVVAQERQGIEPRSTPGDYINRAIEKEISVGAALMAPDQVRHTFVTDLNRGYIVVEVGIYPVTGKKEKIALDHFLLHSGKLVSRPAGPTEIARILQKTSTSGHDVTVYPTAGIGYESGPPTYDPYDGRTHGGGVRTMAGVGVGVGRSGPGANTEADRKTMESELTDKGLHEGEISEPVAGYLYFPVTGKKSKASYQLEFTFDGKKILLNLGS